MEIGISFEAILWAYIILLFGFAVAHLLQTQSRLFPSTVIAGAVALTFCVVKWVPLVPGVPIVLGIVFLIFVWRSLGSILPIEDVKKFKSIFGAILDSPTVLLLMSLVTLTVLLAAFFGKH